MALARGILDLELLIVPAAAVPQLWSLGVARFTHTEFHFALAGARLALCGVCSLVPMLLWRS